MLVGTRTAILPFAPTLTADLVLEAAPYFAVAMIGSCGVSVTEKIGEPIIHFSVALAWRPIGVGSFLRLRSSSRFWNNLQALHISFHAAWSVRSFWLDKIRQRRKQNPSCHQDFFGGCLSVCDRFCAFFPKLFRGC